MFELVQNCDRPVVIGNTHVHYCSAIAILATVDNQMPPVSTVLTVNQSLACPPFTPSLLYPEAVVLISQLAAENGCGFKTLATITQLFNILQGQGLASLRLVWFNG